jgi:hypothetical protein
MRSLRFFAIPLVLLLGGCPSDPGYSLVCEDVLADGSRADIDCGAIVEAVDVEMTAGEELTQAAVWAFVGCPPGAFCGLTPHAERTPLPTSALIGIRTADGDANMWTVNDVAAHPLSPIPSVGYDADDFIDGLARSAAASRTP